MKNKFKWNQIFEYLDTEHTGRIKIKDLISKLKYLGVDVPVNSKLMQLYKEDKQTKNKVLRLSDKYR